MILGISLIGTALFLTLLCVILRHFKKEFFPKKSQKNPVYSFFFGISAFLYEKFLILKPDALLVLKEKLRSTHSNENADELAYYYIVKTISTPLLTIICAFFISGVLLIVSDKSSLLTSVTRPDYSEGSTDLLVNVTYEDGSSEDITITIDPLALSFEEAFEIVSSSEEDIINEILGNNESKDHVCESLNLITSFEGKFNISWDGLNTQYVSYSGNLQYDNIPESGVCITLMPLAKIGDYEIELNFSVILYQKPETEAEGAVAEINAYINSADKLLDSTVSLPTSISSGKVTFIKKASGKLVLIPVFTIIFAFFLMLVQKSRLNTELKERNLLLSEDYVEIVSKLSLLYNAGLNIKNSLMTILNDYMPNADDKKSKEQKNIILRPAYEEIRLTLMQIKSGIPEGKAYLDFGKRCNLAPYRKLGMLLEQTLNKGSTELEKALQDEAYGALMDSRLSARAKGEKISTKLIVPMTLMLLLIMIIIMYAAFASI